MKPQHIVFILFKFESYYFNNYYEINFKYRIPCEIRSKKYVT